MGEIGTGVRTAGIAEVIENELAPQVLIGQPVTILVNQTETRGKSNARDDLDRLEDLKRNCTQHQQANYAIKTV
jgi:hypothetical protein